MDNDKYFPFLGFIKKKETKTEGLQSPTTLLLVALSSAE
jgi:hypothetical protein